MLDALVPALARVAETWTPRSAALKALGVIVASVATMVAARFIPVEELQVVVGAGSGLVLFCGLYLLWAAALPPGPRQALNWRGTQTLPRRRLFVAWAAGGWAVLLILLGSALGGPVAGGLTTAFILCLWRAGTASQEERDELAKQMEQLEAEQAALDTEEGDSPNDSR